MHEVFRQHVEALHPKFELMMAMKPITFGRLSDVPAKPGIYLLSEPSEHLYIGRAKDLRARLKMHIGTDPLGASFAVKLTRLTMNRPATYKKDNSLKQLRTETAFSTAFGQASARIRAMNIRFIEEHECNRQALLEIYAALALNTRYNDFETH